MLRPATQSLLRVAPQVRAGSVRTNTTTRSVISAPPAVRIPFGEKVAHGLMITVGILTYPMYAILDVRHIKLEKLGLA